MHKTILLGLNELNFDFIQYYIDQGVLPNFKKILSKNSLIETVSESEYKLLEPWIQWVTVHTGKTYDEHKVFRLGDIVSEDHLDQIFEELEQKGKTIGAISPFNAANRLKNADFFIPDPWTNTKADGNWVVQNLYKAIRQSVNDNSQEKLQIGTLLSLVLGLVLYTPMSRWGHYLKAALNRKLPGQKAVILDSLLSDTFLKLWKSKKPDFANLFLNSGAHIQHHYLFNSAAYEGEFSNPDWYCPKDYDPLIEILKEYDITIGKLLELKNVKLIIATGLHQQPHRHMTYYWRLKDHANFMNLIGIDFFSEISPRMSRDFLIAFDTPQQAAKAEAILNSYRAVSDNKKIFKVDNRKTTLFVELVYASDIGDDFAIYPSPDKEAAVPNFKNYVAFVAIKNGEHNGIGYLISNVPLTDKPQVPLKEVKDIIYEQVMNEEVVNTSV